MSLSNSAVADRFRSRRNGNGGNMSTDGTILFSYMTPIAQWGHKLDGSPVVLINGDRFSVTSSQHVGQLGWNFRQSNPTVSFSALLGAGLAWRRGRGAEVQDGVKLVDYQQDLYASVDDTDPLYADLFKNMPIGATPWSTEQKWETMKKYYCRDEWHTYCSGCSHAETGYEKVRIPAKRGYHRAGTVVLRYGGYDYLCGFDEGSYFVSKLPLQVNSVEGAFLVLMPKAVMGQEFLRQGEWFFVQAPQDVLEELALEGQRSIDHEYKKLVGFNGLLPGCEAVGRAYMALARKRAAGMGPKYTWTGFKRISRRETLPRVNSRSNPHDVTYLYMHNGFLLAGGTVTHPQHKRLKLGDKQVFMVFKNNSLGDWSAQGNVD